MEGELPLPAHLAPGAVIAERYRLERLLGRGAMGAVFEATAPDGKRVALKALFRIAGGMVQRGERARFLREASVSRSLASEHIIQVQDHGFDPETGTPFLVMDLLEGQDLESAINRNGPLEPRLATTIILQACRGLEVAHGAGIVHRDIKPSNLFLHDSGAAITAKVCDFGIAKVLDQDSLTATGSVMGSPLFMAPEQFIDSKGVDERSDVWSLAMALYHALAGKPAFYEHETFAQLVVAVTTGKIPPLQSLAPWVSGELACVVHGALLVNRAFRCPSIHEFAQALEVAVPSFPTLARGAIVPMTGQQRAHIAEVVAVPAHWRDVASAHGSLGAADPLLGQVLAGRYRLERVLGRGGMGAVYEAKTNDGESFAVKVIRPDLGDTKGREAIRRFVREAKASQGIDSPYVARIVDAGADDARGVPYLAMELLRGRDLGALIKDVGPLEPSSILPAFVQACAGLAAAHARGIVHRDIKPANLFLHEMPNGEVVAKLCDFGVAKQLVQVDEAGELTRTGGMLGSPMYMSPEQAQNAKNVDYKSDLWSLGVSLYEALTGTKAWEGSTMGELILAICTRELQPMVEIAPWVRPEIADVVRRATERDPAKRFSSADEFAAALRPLVGSAPMTTRTIRGVSPERRRAAIAARASGRLPNFGDSSVGSVQPTSAVSIDRPPARSRAPLMAVVAAVSVLGVAGGVIALRGSHAAPQAAAAQAPTASTVPVASGAPVVAVSLTPPPEVAAMSATPTVSSPAASIAPIAAATAKKPLAAPIVSAAAAAPTVKPPPAPSFKTTW